jgi:hypothetical protein
MAAYKRGRLSSQTVARWRIKSVVDPDDWRMVERHLIQNEGLDAIISGFYPEGTVITIEAGELAGDWRVNGFTLVKVSDPGQGNVIEVYQAKRSAKYRESDRVFAL